MGSSGRRLSVSIGSFWKGMKFLVRIKYSKHDGGLRVFQASAEFQAIHAGHVVVERSQAVLVPPGQFQGGRAVVGHVHRVAKVQENVRHRGTGA